MQYKKYSNISIHNTNIAIPGEGRQLLRYISDINTLFMEIKLSFHAIVATVNGTLHRSTLDFFSAVVTADTDSLFKNRENTLRAKTRDMILRCA
jgi:hypothetical protein